jgi:hypothetical protein
MYAKERQAIDQERTERETEETERKEKQNIQLGLVDSCAECSETQTEEYSDSAAEEDGAREGSEEEAVETAASRQGQETLEPPGVAVPQQHLIRFLAEPW